MAIQYGTGPIVIDPDDLYLMHNGIEIAVKVRQVIWPVVMGCVKQPDGTWKSDVELTDNLFASDPPQGGDVVKGWIDNMSGGDTNLFIKDYILPRLNAWLAKVFVPSATVSPISELNAKLGAIKFVVQPDNTVKAVL